MKISSFFKFALVLFLMVTLSAEAQQLESSTAIVAISCEYDDVNNAVVKANLGDMIVVPAGTCVWGNIERFK